MDAEKKAAVELLIKKNILVSPELLSKIEKIGMKGIQELENNPAMLQEALQEQAEKTPSVHIAFSYNETPKKRDCKDFVDYFNARYNAIEKILASRPEMKNTTTVGRLKLSKGRNISLIGAIMEKQTTKKGNILLKIEDPTGIANVLVNKNKRTAYETATDSVHDEIIGITGMSNGDIIFANNILLPEIPIHELKKSPYEGHAIFLSDLHVGSKKFLSEPFTKFLKWINGTTGSPEQRDLAKKVKYVFIAGDIVDGVGIYPNQEEELEITDIYEQYKRCAELLRQIPVSKKIIIAPGNHDSMRISEPQPSFQGDIFQPLLKLPNIYPVSNPAYITIDKTPDFPGIDVLLYHGYSFDYYVANVESIRTTGGYDRGDLIMKFLLQRRHLAPAHSSTLYIPGDTDPLTITRVPDIFATGHIHRSAVSSYKGVTLISSSCWQGKTSFQERLGHKPQPARVPTINLKTREAKVLKFGTDEE
ncbi:DNA-directed DNA polymerase II small subunit [Candidatus Woesearchaeota archaeon]|nr:DNA-directed DNA polymerase II small subunit [Candidatus Woesearchaeota archaeon]